MPKSIEAQGVTVDEAIQNALNTLGLGRDSVEIEIIHHPRSGFLGIGARRAKVRATQREQVMRDGEEFDMSPEGGGRGRRRRRSGRRRSGRGPESRPRGAPADQQPQRRAAQEGKRQEAGGQTKRQGDSPQGERSRSESGQRQEGRGKRGGRSRGSGEGRRGGGGRGGRETAAETEASGETEAQREGRGEPAGKTRTAARVEPEQLRERAEQVTAELLARMGYDADVAATVTEAGGVDVVVTTQQDPEGLLVGRRGTTLDALEHLINRMAAGADSGARTRVSLDVCGYREQRGKVLGDLARRMRDHVVATGRRAQVTPLSPNDRVIVQEALAGDETVTTRVSGSGFYRRVVVSPRGQQAAPGAAAEFSDEGYLLHPGEEASQDEGRDEDSAARDTKEDETAEGPADESSDAERDPASRLPDDGA